MPAIRPPSPGHEGWHAAAPRANRITDAFLHDRGAVVGSALYTRPRYRLGEDGAESESVSRPWHTIKRSYQPDAIG